MTASTVGQRPTTIGDGLRAAAGIVRECGHVRGVFEDDRGRVCAMKAIVMVFGFDKTEQPRRFMYLATGSESVARWNDEDGRTEAEVIAAMETAAVLADTEAQQ